MKLYVICMHYVETLKTNVQDYILNILNMQ